MSRLIDADKAIEWIDIEYPKLDRQDMKQMIDAQPTAYDIDEVTKQLEEAKLYSAIEIVRGGVK